MGLLKLIVKNVRRNLVRSTLTALGTMVLVFVVTLVWSILAFLDQETAEKSSDLKAIITERWQLPSRMPFTYAEELSRGAARRPGDRLPDDSMTWQFFGGTLDPENRTRENSLFAFALEPRKLRTMMTELDRLPPGPAAELDEAIGRMERNRRGMIVGRERLETLNKRVGDRFTLHCFNFRGIELEFEVVGAFPESRYNNSAAINRDYLNAAFDAYPRTHNGQPHPDADKTLALVWLRMADVEAFNQIGSQILNSPVLTSPSVKYETESSGVSSFLDSYRDMLWGMRWLLAPAVLISLSLVISNAISIGVRERQTELAVLKVLGFRPRQILLLVIGEALLIGGLAGLASAGLTYAIINHVLGGFRFPIAFFGAFYIPLRAIGWGLAVGVLTALAGSLIPARSACRVNVAQVFAKVA